jgi:hypothetical protein
MDSTQHLTALLETWSDGWQNPSKTGCPLRCEWLPLVRQVRSSADFGSPGW